MTDPCWPAAPDGAGRSRIRPALVVAGVSGITGALAYSSFLASGLAGSRLGPLNSYVSELGAAGQPGRWFFRASDALAGVLIVVLASGVRSCSPRDRQRSAGSLALGLAGVASLFDAWRPLPCAPSVDALCRLHEQQLGLWGQLREPHTLSGVLGVVAAIMSMLLLSGAFLNAPRQQQLGRIGRATAVAVTVLALTEVPLSLTGQGIGVVERLHVLGVSAWLASLGAFTLSNAGGGGRRS